VCPASHPAGVCYHRHQWVPPCVHTGWTNTHVLRRSSHAAAPADHVSGPCNVEHCEHDQCDHLWRSVCCWVHFGCLIRVCECACVGPALHVCVCCCQAGCSVRCSQSCGHVWCVLEMQVWLGALSVLRGSSDPVSPACGRWSARPRLQPRGDDLLCVCGPGVLCGAGGVQHAPWRGCGL
jgi:hypothetical protein